jgi:hypothetical protein
MDLPHEDKKTKSAHFTSGVIAASALDPELLVFFFEAGSRVKLARERIHERILTIISLRGR